MLSTILGGYAGVTAIGEFRMLWHTLENDERCGCGVPISQCPFWTSVAEQALGGWERVDLDAMLKADHRFARHSSIPRVVASRLGIGNEALPRIRRSSAASMRQSGTSQAHT